MDKKQIIILLIIAGIYIFNAIRKMKTKAQVNNDSEEESHSPFEEFKEEYKTIMDEINNRTNSAPKKTTLETQMSKKNQFVSEFSESTSLEAESLESFSNNKPPQKTIKNNIQVLDNEEDTIDAVSIDSDDIRRGFIYSEILKKKYN